MSELQRVRQAIEEACQRAARPVSGVRLVGACKTLPAERITPYVEAGLADLAENYVQEARAKQPVVPFCHWHLIGPLQLNKVNQALRIFDWVHTLDRFELVEALDQRVSTRRMPLRALIQVRLGAEETKHGLDPEGLFDFLEELRRVGLAHLRLHGLMTIPPPVEEAEESRPYFRQLRELLEQVVARDYPFWAGSELSMGMSDDYEVAVEEGATLVRVGRALFGAR